MPTDNLSFFQSETQTENSLSKQDEILVEVYKELDALINYESTLATALLRTTSLEEIIEIMLSAYLPVDEIPKINKTLDTKAVENMKKQVIVGMLQKVKYYKDLKDMAANGNLNELFLDINQFCMQKEDNTYKPVQIYRTILFSVYGNQLNNETIEKLSKKIHKAVNNKTAPLMAEISSLKKAMKSLEKIISPYCIRFREESKVTALKGPDGRPTVKFDVHSEQCRKTNSKIEEFLKNNSHGQLEYLLRELKAPLVLATYENPSKRYLELYKKYAARYQIEEQAIKLLKELQSQAKKTEEQNQLNSKSQIEKASKPIKQPLDQDKDQIEIIESKRSLDQTQPSQSEINPNETKEKELLLEPGLEKEFKEKKSSEQVKQPESKEEQEDKEKSQVMPIKESKREEEDTDTWEKEDYKKYEEKNKARLEYTKSKSKSSKSTVSEEDDKKSQKKVIKPLIKIQDLNSRRRETYLELFSQKPKPVTIRDLVKLCRSLGGTIEPTKANRCRIEIRNIYSDVLLSEEDFKNACEKATVTMHGGGHRQKRSQKSTKNAPSYLVYQFKEALERACYTLENMGLNNENNNSMTTGVNNTSSAYKG
ncbi:hypothetical protein [Legionella gresilensis]|uniref:hypothetical protein n=1 Tax=Legionella gresilensis TaxID=91823 RepID=UPI0010410116|nr:hypothetical protein [Legionella gresilensis]